MRTHHVFSAIGGNLVRFWPANTSIVFLNPHFISECFSKANLELLLLLLPEGNVF